MQDAFGDVASAVQDLRRAELFADEMDILGRGFPRRRIPMARRQLEILLVNETLLPATGGEQCLQHFLCGDVVDHRLQTLLRVGFEELVAVGALLQ